MDTRYANLYNFQVGYDEGPQSGIYATRLWREPGIEPAPPLGRSTNTTVPKKNSVLP